MRLALTPAGFSGQFPIENEYADALKQEQEVAKGLAEAREVAGRHTSADRLSGLSAFSIEGATNADVILKLAEMMTAGFAAFETKLDQRLGAVERRVAQVEECLGTRAKVRAMSACSTCSCVLACGPLQTLTLVHFHLIRSLTCTPSLPVAAQSSKSLQTCLRKRRSCRGGWGHRQSKQKRWVETRSRGWGAP